MPADICALCRSSVWRSARSLAEITCHQCRRALKIEARAMRLDIKLVRRQVRQEITTAARNERRRAQRAARLQEILSTPRTCGGCGKPFIPAVERQRFCSTLCSARILGTKPHGWTNKRGRGQRYGAAHQAERRARAARHQPKDPCVRCGQPLGPIGPHLHLDHDESDGYLGFAHGRCNLTAGATKAHADQKAVENPALASG